MPENNGEEPNAVASVPEEVTGQTRRVVLKQLHWRNTFASLRHRNFRLFFGGQLISLTGTWMQNTAQAWLVYELTGSKIMLGAVAAIGSTPMMLFSLWGGSVADRHSKRRIVLGTQTAMMLFAFLFAGLVWSGHIRPWHIMVLAALGGCVLAFDLPARQAFMVEMTSREDLINAISLNSSLVNGARVIGPAVAGLLMARVGIATCFLLNGLSFVAVIVGLCLMRLPRFVAPQRPASAWAHAAEGFSYVWRHGRMRTLLLLFAVVGVFGWSYSVLMPAFARDVLGVGQGRYGVLLSANGIGALLGALTVASVGKHVDRRVLVLGGLWFFSVMLLLLGWAQSYALALVLLALAGWGMLLFFSTTNTLLQTSASDQMRGRVMGIWTLVFGGTTPLGGLEAGTVSHFLGVRWAITSGAIVCALAALVVWWVVPQRGEPRDS
jgi:MFS family permease